MREDTRKHFERLRGSFLWVTSYGATLKVDEMDTKHVFNCMKMMYNHLAAANNLPTFWFNHVYREYEYLAKHRPKKLIEHLLLFVYIIEERGDLPDRYREPYESIITTLRMIAATTARTLYRELEDIKREEN